MICDTDEPAITLRDSFREQYLFRLDPKRSSSSVFFSNANRTAAVPEDSDTEIVPRPRLRAWRRPHKKTDVWWHLVRGCTAFRSGKWRWNVTIDQWVQHTDCLVGVCSKATPPDGYCEGVEDFVCYKPVGTYYDGKKVHEIWVTAEEGDTIHVELDCDSRTIAFTKNEEASSFLQFDLPHRRRGLAPQPLYPAVWLHFAGVQVSLRMDTTH
eukprot:TRINITY_DN15482_c0_g1_i2.p1 TRINITY_DN15482_c0_g1~~TRINITY_DN15482_c0_g1_i2.p1  ORF type:complete len:211 (-),score=17.83 TRINITY_DN15482_c0_g1_i2:20-652(-)